MFQTSGSRRTSCSHRAAVDGPSPLKTRSATMKTLDLFLTREAAEAELLEILQDEPDWKDMLRVVPVELDGRQMSVN
jgi:hypothetical protein